MSKHVWIRSKEKYLKKVSNNRRFGTFYSRKILEDFLKIRFSPPGADLGISRGGGGGFSKKN